MVPQSKISFAREASRSDWSASPRLQGLRQIHHFGTPNLSKIPSLNKRPLVPRVAPMGSPAESKIRQKVAKIVSHSPLKSDAGKTYVSDRLKH